MVICLSKWSISREVNCLRLLWIVQDGGFFFIRDSLFNSWTVKSTNNPRLLFAFSSGSLIGALSRLSYYSARQSRDLSRHHLVEARYLFFVSCWAGCIYTYPRVHSIISSQLCDGYFLYTASKRTVARASSLAYRRDGVKRGLAV